jgi:hypothetical protein
LIFSPERVVSLGIFLYTSCFNMSYLFSNYLFNQFRVQRSWFLSPIPLSLGLTTWNILLRKNCLGTLKGFVTCLILFDSILSDRLMTSPFMLCKF